MIEIKLKQINESIFYEKLDNGLDIYLYSKNDYHNNYVTFTTKFGSINHRFVPIGEDKMISVPLGIAHFLEHKVFAQKDDPQPSDFYAKTGTLNNAFTTFKNTTYLFSGPNDLIENINYLLDFVQSPYFADDNVKAEKGIITQEIHMCDDRPMDVLYEHIRKTTLHTNAYKDSIIGEVKDINKINKELLYKCYNTFYHPSNMFMVITGNFDKDIVVNSIIENQRRKDYKKVEAIKTAKLREKDTIVKSRDIVKINTKISKVSYNIKIPIDKFNIDKRKLNIYMYVLFGILFDDSSLFDEKAKNESVITNSMYVNILNTDTHFIVSLISETNKYEELIKLIRKELSDIKIKVDDLERKKKVLISNEIFSFENIEIVNEMIIDNIMFDNHIEEDIIKVINSLNINELNSIINKIDFKNVSEVILTSKK